MDSVAKTAATAGSKSIALVAHEFGRYPGHGGIAVYLKNLVDSILAHTDFHIHVFCVQHQTKISNERITIHKLSGLDFSSQRTVTKKLQQIQPSWVEVAEFGALCLDYLIQRAVGRFTGAFPVIVNHHTGCREIWEWGSGVQFEACTDAFLAGAHAQESAQSILADANVSVSTFLTQYLHQRYDWRFIAPLHPYFPLVEKATEVPSKEVRGKTLTILSLGRFEPRKRQENLISATLDLLKDGISVHVNFVGNTVGVPGTGEDYREICYRKIPPSLRKHFSFWDFASPEAVEHLYKEADLFCIPSLFENFPTTALEAISMGLPVMGSQASGLVDMVGSAGLYFDPLDSTSLSRALRSVSAMSKKQLLGIADEQFRRLSLAVSVANTTLKRLDIYSQIKVEKPTASHNAKLLLILDEPTKKGRRLAAAVKAKYPSIEFHSGHDAFDPNGQDDTVGVFFFDDTPLAVVMALVSLAKDANHLLPATPVALSKAYVGSTSLAIALRAKTLPAFLGFLSGPANQQLGCTSLHEHLAASLCSAREFAYLCHPQAILSRKSIALQTYLSRRHFPFVPDHAYHSADPRADLRLLSSGTG
ncbi:glycosyltransferase [Aquabacterium soli]|jgi:glycosyltransferase involved in cell wall biosynthesis|uniref:Glycosyltransferase n=1 Tax=Aquabacterium soli TaxID=2493092 RepID=A0A426VBT6_9BURK|nr:glycosyltransferase family 4 protein [Aquabacterium soli]RRS04363.1 glycosyltransferase [Aquabacterium soli]